MARKPYGPNPWQQADEESEIVQRTESRSRILPSTSTSAGPSPVAVNVAGDEQATPIFDSGRRQIMKSPDRLERIMPTGAEVREDFFAKPEPSKFRRRRILFPEEAERFGPRGIEAQKRFEAEGGRIAEEISDPLSPESMTLATPESGGVFSSASISVADAKNLMPISRKKDFESKEDFVLSNYPTLFAAAKNAGLGRDEVYDVINLTLAVDAALVIGVTESPLRQNELLRTMSKPQQALTIDVLNAIYAQGRSEDGSVGYRKVRSKEVDPDESLNPISNFIKNWAWDPSIDISGLPFVYPDTNWGPIQDGELYGGGKGIIDTLVSSSEMAVRGAGTLAYVSSGQSLTNSWNATGAGQFDAAMVKKIKSNNDPLTVDILLDLKKFSAMGVEDVEGAVLEKYGDQPNVLRILDEIIFNTDPNSEIALLGNEIDLAETSNIGNLMAWSFVSPLGIDPNDYDDIKSFASSDLAMSAVKLTTVGATVGLDPWLGLARFGSGVRSARFGLSKISKTIDGKAVVDSERLEKVFNNGAVRTHYDYLGSKFEDIRSTTKIVDGKEVVDSAAQAQKLETLSSQMRKWYDYNALRVMYDSGIKTADDAKAFMIDGTNVNLLLSGRGIKRGKEFTVPHMTKANAVFKAVTFKARGFNPASAGGPRQFIDSIYGDGVSSVLDDEAANAVARKIEADPESAGRILSDWAITGEDGVQRTILGKIIKYDPESYKLRNRYGWRRKGLLTGDLGWFADRVGRLMARIPDSGSIAVDSGTDASLIKQYIQSIGMSRYFANTVKFAWSTWDEPTRIRFVNALNRSAIYSSGMDLVNPELADDLINTFAKASNTGTKYAPDQVDILAIRYRAEQNVNRMNDARRESNLEEFTKAERAKAVDEQMDLLAGQQLTPATGAGRVAMIDEVADTDDIFNAWRNQILDDEDLLEKFYLSTQTPEAIAARKEYVAGQASVDSSKNWINEPLESTGFPGKRPSEVGGDTKIDGRFINDGTISRKTLQEIEERLGSEGFYMWMQYGELDDVVTSIERAASPVSRRIDASGNPIRGWKGVPEEWTFGAGKDAERIPVPFAAGGAKARSLGRNKTERAERIEAENIAAEREAFDNQLKSGALDDDLDRWMVAQREAGVERFQLPGVAGKPAKEVSAKNFKGLSKQERILALREEIIQGVNDARLNGGISNPSALNATDNYALYDSQLTKRISLFNPMGINQLMARQSYLNMLLGGGPKITTTTDWWVLLTLAGPRFVMRSGIEDFGLYALTNGQFFGSSGWLMGRKASEAMRESIERVEPTQRQIIRGSNKGLALGLAATTRREIGTRLARRIPVMRGLVLDYADPQELAAATAMATAKGSEKSREGIANLFSSLFARSRFFSMNRVRYAKGEPLVLEGKNKQVAEWISDGVNRGYLNSNMERVAETGQHLADGSLPMIKAPSGYSEVVDGVVINYDQVAISQQRVKEVTKGYETSWQSGARNADDVEQLYMDLDNILYQDGTKGYIAIARSAQYYSIRRKVLETQDGTGDDYFEAIEEYNKFIDEYVEILQRDPSIDRFVLAKELDIRQFAERKLEDALRIMTTGDGKFNHALYNKLKLPEGVTPAAAGRKINVESTRKFGLYYFDENDKFRYNVTAESLHDPKIPMPQSVQSADNITVPIVDKIPFSTRAWAKMGRALARLTREPIYLANYVDMRNLVEPFRLRMVDDLVANGKEIDDAIEMSSEWASKAAADKAYGLTMDLVDNPSVRSQLAWQVRNVARFYRALEDFNRRMVRVAENKPEVFWKMALTWNVLDESGFVWEDEFGEKYFMFPGTQVAFDMVNKAASALGIQARVPSVPMTWGAKVSMLAPSTDPNALVPTLGSPFSALTIKSVLRVLPSLPMLKDLADGLKNVPVAGAVSGFVSSQEGARALEGALFGEYSVNQTLVSSLANDVFGPNLKRFMDVFTATQGGFSSRDAATDTYIAGASKRAIHAVVAAGIYDPKKDYTEEELQEIRNIADVTAVNETWLRLFLVPMLIATPQSISLDVSEIARELGIDSGSAAWLKTLNRYDSYEDAFIAFTKNNPGKAIFTVSKYESNDYYQMLIETENFIKENFEEFKERPTGLSHFAPQEGTYGGLNSFYFMRANDIRVPTTVEDFWQKSIRSAGQAEIYWIENQADNARSKSANEDSIKIIDKAESESKKKIKDIYPYSEFGLDFSLDRKSTNARDADEIAETARYVMDNGLDSDGRAKKYLDVYNEYTLASREMGTFADSDDQKEYIRAAWRKYIEGTAMPMFVEDKRGLRFLKILSGALAIDVEGLQ